MSFTHRLRVRYAEVDAQGVVFNAHWLTYFDEAMTAFFEDHGFPADELWTAGGPFDVQLVKSQIEWRGPAGFHDLVETTVDVARIGESSFVLDFTARVADEVVTVGEITYVSVAPGGGSSRPIPDEIRDVLEGAMAAA